MFDWTDKAIGEACAMRAEGKSWSEIARHLGGGVSRAAVIAKMLRVEGRMPTWTPPPPPAPPVPLHIAVMDLKPHHCRFIPGEPSSGACGHPRKAGRPYCEYHCGIAYRKPSEDR